MKVVNGLVPIVVEQKKKVITSITANYKEHVIFDGENDLSNCVPACQECNSEKWEFSFEVWYNEANFKYSQKRHNRIQKWVTEDYKQYIIKKKPRKPYGSCKK